MLACFFYIAYMGKRARVRATDVFHFMWQRSPVTPTCSRLVFCILNIVLQSSRTAASVKSVLVSLGMIYIVTGMARGVNRSAPVTIVEADCFSSSCQQEFSGFFKSLPPTYKVYGLKYKLSCVLKESLDVF